MPTAPTITITGNLVRDPELRFTPRGHAVCKFTVACTPRDRNADGTWTDGDAQYWDVTAWRGLAENCAESLERGNPVIVTGTVRFREWETRDGEKRHQHEITADVVGISLAFTAARALRAKRSKTAPAANGNAETSAATETETGESDPASVPF